MSPNYKSQLEEAGEIVEAISYALPTTISGKFAIELMRDEGSRNWKQMEWIGFWFEHVVESRVIPTTGGAAGPTYGRTRFDFQRKHVWDLKVHLDSSDWLILNDQEATRSCIEENDGMGFFVVSGSAEFDSNGVFKSWHDALKGGTSQYESERIERGAVSRRRKIAFIPQKIDAYWLPDETVINTGVSEGWIKDFQTGMRNSNGVARRSKFQVSPSRIPSKFRLIESHL